MAANKKISEFDELLSASIDGSEWLGGYKTDPTNPNSNIRLNIAEFKANIVQAVNIIGTKSIIYGGAAWSGTGLIFNVSEVKYNYYGETGIIPPTTITLDDGDGEDRIDLIAVNKDIDEIVVIKGTPDVNPTPQEVEAHIIPIQMVYVKAHATTPDVDQIIVYRNHVEWNTSTLGTITGTVNFDSPNNPVAGSVVTAIDGCDRNAVIVYTSPSGLVSYGNFTFLSFYVRIRSALPSHAYTVLRNRKNGNNSGTAINLKNHGLNVASMNSWQLIALPTSLFNAPNGDSLSFQMISGSASLLMDWDIDNIVLSDGIPPPQPPGGIPGWAQVLTVDANSGPNSPRINAGQKIDFETNTGQIMRFAGIGGGMTSLYNAFGNLVWKVPNMGVSADGVANLVNMNSSGHLRSRFFYQNSQLILPFSAAVVWSWSYGNNATLTLTGDCSLSIQFKQATTANLMLIQGGVGGHLVDFLNQITWPDNTEPTWSTVAGKMDLISFISDGVDVIGTAIIGYEL